MSDSLNNMGLIYTNLGNFDKAIEFLFRAFEIDKQIKSDYNITIDLNNIGRAFWYRGLLNNLRSDIEKSLHYYEEALKLAQNYKISDVEVRILNNIGSIHNHLRNYSVALDYFAESFGSVHR